LSRSSILPSNPFGGHTQQSSISSPSRSHLPQLAPRPTSTILAQNAYGKVIPASPASELNLSASGVSYALRARLDCTSSSHSLIPNTVHPDHTQTHRKSQTFPARSSEGLESCFSLSKSEGWSSEVDSRGSLVFPLSLRWTTIWSSHMYRDAYEDRLEEC